MQSSCDLGNIIRKHMKFIMKVFQPELQEYHMNEVVTKCLNTAVTTMFLFLGKSALTYTRECDVQAVQERRKKNKTKDMDLILVENFTKAMMQPNDQRHLYYIMITDSNIPHVESSKPDVMFPGHVFVLDKYTDPVENKPCYNMYQSYINEYDLNGAITRNKNSMHGNYDDILKLTENIDHMFRHGIWDQKVIEFWKWLTFVDSEELRYHIIRGHIFFCYREIPVTSCTNILYQKLQEKKKNNSIEEKDLNEYNEILLNLKSKVKESK